MLVRIKWTLYNTDWKCTIDISNNMTLGEIKKLALEKVGIGTSNKISNLSIEIIL